MIRIGIAGYGSISRGVEYAIEQSGDMELAAIFTRRPSQVKPRTDTPVVSFEDAAGWADKIDVMILCGGSFSDLPVQGPMFAEYFNTVDSFDTHTDIPEYFEKMDTALKSSGKLGLVSSGWDPGLFSVNRLWLETILPDGLTHTFWGMGISQGHSNAIRQVEGVLDGVQYTCPVQEAIDEVRSGSMPQLTSYEKHTRKCYVVLKEGADAEKVRSEIINMPYYFKGYDTEVNFVTAEELKRDYSSPAHRGFVFRSGKTGETNKQHAEFSIDLESNAEFTASILVAYARAVSRMAAQGMKGAVTVFDVAPGLLSPKSGEQLRKELL